jgi:acyl carrier protein
VHFFVAIEDHFKRKKLGFEDLIMKGGRYIEDVSVAQVAAFLIDRLDIQGVN